MGKFYQKRLFFHVNELLGAFRFLFFFLDTPINPIQLLLYFIDINFPNVRVYFKRKVFRLFHCLGDTWFIEKGTTVDSSVCERSGVISIGISMETKS